YYPTERGPYNLDADNIDPDGGALLNPEKRWGGIMRKLDNTNFEQSNIEYVQFWMMNPFLDPDNPNTEGGDLYFNFGEISEDILKDGLKSYENGIPYDGNDRFLEETVWGRVSKQPSLTYSFDNNTGSRKVQDVGLDGISTADEFGFDTYAQFVQKLRNRLSPTTVAAYEEDRFSPLNDPAGDNYHFYRGHDYDEERLGILDRYKRYNGVEGNSLSPEDADDNLYQSSRATPDVEDINQDNTLNEYERYFQYRVSIRPEDLEVGRNYITDKQVSYVPLRNGQKGYVEWYQFKIPLQDWERKVGSISDFSAMRFVRMFMTGFRAVTHLRFATLELVRGEWRNYKFNLNNRADTPAEGQLDVSVVNIEENAGRTPVNYVLPPGVSRLSNPGESQIVQLNEQSMSMKVEDLQAGDARGVYRDMQHDLRNYKRLQMWVHAEALIDNLTELRSGQLSLFVRLGSDVKANYYEYEIPLTLTPPGPYNGDYNSQREMVWPLSNRLDFELQQLVNLKRERNREQNAGTPGVSFNKRFSGRDPENEANTITVIGNPSLSDVRVMLIGVRNTSPMTKSGTVWVNELKVTDFNEEGGWAAKANVNLSMSDIATFNFGAHIETAGFGGVDQSLNERRMDDYQQLNFAMQIDAGRFLPEKAKLHAPIYFSTSRERITPQYNPLDQDVKLSDALDACVNEAQRDSIKAYAIEETTVQSFSISGLKFDVKSKNPMPWDPANFTINFSFNKQKFTDPTTEYQHTNDYRGSLAYNYSPFKRGFKPLSAAMKGKKGKGMKFLADWEFNYLPNNISFLTTMSRYYYEQQVRSEIDDNFQLPVSVSKNFLWDRQLNISWNLTKSLNFTFNSNTSARIEETAGAVNRRLFPDRYREWKDTVMSSIRKLGTPWSYNQTFTGSYKAPFNQIPATDWLTASASYNATYQWDRGATVDGYSTGNAIANQATLTADGRVNLEGLFNKVPYLKKVNQRFGGTASARNVAAAKRADRPKRFERTLKLKEDTSLVIKHNLKVPKVKVTAATTAGQPFEIETRKIDDNSLEVLTRDSRNLKFTIIEVKEKPKKNVWSEIAAYTTRLIMSPRSVNVHFRTARTMSIPLWRRSVGAAFGQSNGDGPLAPGLDFAFGFVGESFVERAKERGWLITDDGQTSPANMTNTNELRAEMSLEPIKGMKITLTTNRTDNRTRQVQFMYDNMPVSRSGNFTMTHVALASALRTSKAADGYYDPTFQRFLDYIPLIAARVQGQYTNTRYPTGGFMAGHAQAGKPFNPQVGTVSTTSSDVLIPAFLAAYTGKSPGKQYLSPFPSFAAALPNWKLTYDGLINLGKLRNIFKSIQITHAYQCTYTVGSYSGYLNWIAADGSSLGFTLDELSGQPIPSSPYNIASVAIRESFAPLAGLSVTLKNDIRFSAEYKDSRTLTLNSSAGQLVEARQQGVTVGAGWKIANFNSVLKIKGKQTGVSNDLNLNADFSYAFSQALIRRIESNYTQATSGTRNFSVQASANYSLSRRITLGLYFDHQVNTPLVSTSAYPTSNTSFGFNINLSLAR
ncbi:MAG: cell surface protein SprA, partial [Muribaculaceae bacterium]|nr:cell surface protein SprA [Muribaculaceae bacterium]